MIDACYTARMPWLADVGIAILTGYIALTGALAESIERTFLAGEVEPTPLETPATSTPAGFASLPSAFSDLRIPDILRESAAYQQAAVAGASTVHSTTRDPLEAIVNIYCTYTTDDYIRTTTGTGFFVHADGVIMTNAHIAQFLLLEETTELGETVCRIRTGDPALARYRAELLYLPPAWLTEHAALIDAKTPMGTGERDYALLYVSEAVDASTLPERFPSLRISTELLPRSLAGETVTAAGYPADSLRGDSGAALSPVAATTRVSELYTFGSNYADVFSITGSPVGAQGSSGGPVVNNEGAVICMIATRGDDAVDGPGSLRAITVSHIHRTILEETGFSLRQTISGDIDRRGRVFRETLAPYLLTLLQNELQS